MAVYFVYRSHYENPSGKHLTRFDDDNVSDWVRRNWELGRANPDRVAELFPFEVYGFAIFSRPDETTRPPEDDEQLAEWLKEEIYSEGEVLCHLPHLVSVQTDDDELMFAYYIFDDHFAARYPHRAAFLLHDDWRLPGGESDRPFRAKEPTSLSQPAGKGEGATYWIIESFEDSCNLLDMTPAVRVKGVRVGQLARYLAQPDATSDYWSDWWSLLRTQLFTEGATSDPLEERFREALLDNPNDDATWAAYSDWLQEQGFPSAGVVVLEKALRSLATYPVSNFPSEAWDAVRSGTVRQARLALDAALKGNTPRRPPDHEPAKSLVYVDEHVAQLCLHVGRMYGKRDLYHQWIFFDDRWASAHPAMANSLLRYTRCWDMLSPDGPCDDSED